MELNSNLLYEDVVNIVNNPCPSPTVDYELVIHTPTGDVTPVTFDRISTMGNHMKQFTDVVMITFTIGVGTLQSKLIPYKGKLSASIIKRTSPVDQNVRTFDITLADVNSLQVSSGVGNAGNVSEIDRQRITMVNAQLIDKSVADIIKKEVACVVRNQTVQSTITTLLPANFSLDGDAKQAITKEDWQTGKYSGIVGINMVPPINLQRYKQIVIPRNISLVKLPGFLQEEVGVYTTGIGYYIQSGMWYVYPLYDLTRFDKAPSVLTVANIPPDKFPSVESTWKATGRNVYIVATGDTSHIDISESTQLNQGNGVSFTRASSMMDSYAPVKGNKVFSGKDLNVSSMVTEQRAVNNVRSSQVVATDNYCKELSKLAEATGAIVSFVWQNANEKLMYPGMPCKYLYPKDDIIAELKGTVIGFDTVKERHGKGVLEKKFTTTSIVTLWVTREIEGV